MTAMAIDMEGRRALRDFLDEVWSWVDTWDKGCDDRESLERHGFTLLAHLRHMRRNTLTSAAQKELDARLETSQVPIDPQSLLSTAIRRLEAAAEAIRRRRRFESTGAEHPAQHSGRYRSRVGTSTAGGIGGHVGGGSG